MNAIESPDDRPLRLETCLKGCKSQASKRNGQHIQGEPLIFLSNSLDQPTPSTGGAKSNYLASSVNNFKLPLRGNKTETGIGEGLEIGANRFILNLINECGRTEATITNKHLPSDSPKQPTFGHNCDKTIQRLLEYDSDQQLVSLLSENRILIDPPTASSISIDEELSSPEITGSLYDSFK